MPEDPAPTALTNKVDITFVMANGKHDIIGENGYWTLALRENGITYRNYEGIDIPEGFQTETIRDLTERTRIIAIDCVMAGPDHLRENGGLTTGLRLAEEIRETHPDLPIWLLQPVEDEGDYSVERRAKSSRIDPVSLLSVGPFVFAEKVRKLLRK